MFHEATNSYTKSPILMGDKSPKAAQKQASQKKAQSDSVKLKKSLEVAAKAKQVVTKRK